MLITAYSYAWLYCEWISMLVASGPWPQLLLEARSLYVNIFWIEASSRQPLRCVGGLAQPPPPLPPCTVNPLLRDIWTLSCMQLVYAISPNWFPRLNIWVNPMNIAHYGLNIFRKLPVANSLSYYLRVEKCYIFYPVLPTMKGSYLWPWN